MTEREVAIDFSGDFTNRIESVLEEVALRLDPNGEITFTHDPDSPVKVSNDRFRGLSKPADILYAEIRSTEEHKLSPFPDVPNEKVLYLDIETHNEGRQWDMSPREFFRLGQYAWGIDGEVVLTESYDVIMEQLAKAGGVVVHNGHNFDLSVLYGKDSTTPLLMAQEKKVIDTMVWANLAFPAPPSYVARGGSKFFPKKPGEFLRWLSLDNLAYQFQIPGKYGSLKDIAKKYNPPKTKVADLDFGLIDLNDEDFLAYAKQDIVALQGITHRLCLIGPMNEYYWREQLCAAINAQITRNGFHVSIDAVTARRDELENRRQEIMDGLVRDYDFPTEGKSPWASNAGKEAIVRILADFGITPETHEWPRTPTGALKLGGEDLKKLTEGTDAEEIGNAIAEVKGQRSLSQLTLDCLKGDSRVHPSIDDLQRSGRSCLPETHHLLTRRGVVPVEDIRPGEDETIDHRGNRVKVLGVHRYQNAPVIRYENERVMIESTPEHRWVQWTESRGSREIKPLKRGERRSLQLAPDAYPFDPFEMNLWSHMTPRERTAALVGFLVTDGYASNRSDATAGRFVVYQTENKFYKKIRDFLGDLVTSDYSRPVNKHPQNTIHEMRLRTAEVENILRGERLDWTGGLRNNESLFRWVLTLSRSEVEAFLTAVYISDGNSVLGGSTQIANTNHNKVDTIQYAVYRMGRRSNYREYEDPTNYTLRGRVAILRDRVSVRTLPEPTQYTTDVWCVTTETGTFTAWIPEGRWRGPYLTGNSVTNPGLTVWTSRGDNAVEKAYYTAPEGYKLVSFDYSNADARAVAAYSKDEDYRKNFLPGVDNHMNVARQVYGEREDFDERAKDYRQLAKACVAEGTLVLTDQGEVPIEEITLNHLLWDGESFVKHEGTVYSGMKEVIHYDGITATPDHKVYTTEGLEVPFGVAASRGYTLEVTGDGGRPIPTSHDYFRPSTEKEETEPPFDHICASGVCDVRSKRVAGLGQPIQWENERVSPMHVAGESSELSSLAGEETFSHEATVPEPGQPGVSHVRGEGDNVRLGLNIGSGTVDNGERDSARPDTTVRSGRQRQGVRSGEHSDGDSRAEYGEQEEHGHNSLESGRMALLSECCSEETEGRVHEGRDHSRRSCSCCGAGISLEARQGKVRVYDILNVGPHHRFTANGKLVANCSHAWNYGGGAKTISRAAGVDTDTAQHFVDKMSEAFPGVVAWRNRMATMGERDGFIVNKWGRKMPVERDQAYTQSGALMGQSGTREVMNDAKIKMLEHDPRLVQWIAVPIHDELLFCIPESELAWAVPKIEELMYANWDGVEFHASHGDPADNWYEAGH